MTEEADRPSFRKAFDEIYGLYAEQRYDEALRLAESSRHRFPHRGGATAYWVACLRAVVGDTDGAVAVLRDASGGGHWWSSNMLRGDPDLVALQGRGDFESLIRDSERAGAAAFANTKPDLLVTPPEGVPLGLLLTLHGAYWSAGDFAPYWATATKRGLALAVPQSSQPTTDDGFGWYDEMVAQTEIVDAQRKVLTQFHLDASKTILAGFSQGGGLAVKWALEGSAVPCLGFIAVGPGTRDLDASLSWVQAAAERGLRGWIIVGERDSVRDGAETLHRAATASGMECELEVVPGLAHAIPADFSDRLERAIEFLMGG